MERNETDDVFRIEDGRLAGRFGLETLWIEPWGVNGLRVRGARCPRMQDENWALLPRGSAAGVISCGRKAVIRNGKIRAEVSTQGKITFYNQKNETLLEEYVRKRGDPKEFVSALCLDAREFVPIPGSGDYRLILRFESDPAEKIFGMGQYQQPFLDVKNCALELAHRNSQVSVPFALSSLGYGFLWNNPAIGSVVFGKNITRWTAESAKQIDYWITAGDTPAEIEEDYARVTGTAPMMPDWAMGFWQSKLRYETQDELLEVAREYGRRGLPLSAIVIDFFHWTKQGDWKFDPQCWPDPEGMVRELRQMGVEPMVSVWPTVDRTSENYPEMARRGYFVSADRGSPLVKDFMGNTLFFDATRREAREYVWNIAKRNYYDHGVRAFWLDVAEPEYTYYHFDNYRYDAGPALQVGNTYPLMYAKAFYDGMASEGQRNIVNLIRCAWCGSQRYGALVWSGDIHSSFAALRNQVRAGLNMGLAGIPWWTTDIGGFHGGDAGDPAFRECIVRWFQYGAFCPVFRLHGDREPHDAPDTSGSGRYPSGAPNEVWSYGEEAYEIFKEYMMIRERLRPYVREIMRQAHEKGTPPMRPVFYDFPDDERAWEIDDEYMLGPDILVAPVLYEGRRSRDVYLPSGSDWKDAWTERILSGGERVRCDAPIDRIPLFVRSESELPPLYGSSANRRSSAGRALGQRSPIQPQLNPMKGMTIKRHLCYSVGSASSGKNKYGIKGVTRCPLSLSGIRYRPLAGQPPLC